MTDSYDASDIPENAIEWLKGRKTATVTLAGGTALNTRVRKLAKSKPDKCQIMDENDDHTIVAHIPVSWIKINPERELSETQLAELQASAMKNFHSDRARTGAKAPKTGSKRSS